MRWINPIIFSKPRGLCATQEYGRAALAMDAGLRLGRASYAEHHTHALILQGLGRTVDAIMAEQRALAQYPDFQPAHENLIELTTDLQYSVADEVSRNNFGLTPVDFRAQPERPELEPLMRQAESLGISCELGLVQRHCRAEPLGLFRFGYTPLPGLIDALTQCFAGIGDPEQLRLHQDLDGEWISTHLRYGWEFHTVLLAKTYSEDAVLQKIVPHFWRLAQMLVENLGNGEKIFVYRRQFAMPAGPEARRLLTAMQQYGRPVLLWVDVAEHPAQIGTAEWTIPGQLMTGYLDRYSWIRFAAGLSFDAWINMLTAAVKLKAALP